MRWAATSVRLVDQPIDNMCHPNTNDQLAARAFGATEHVSPLNFERLMEFEAIFVTQWKIQEHFEGRWMNVAHLLCDAGKRVVLFQEAETSWPTTRSWEEQKSLIGLLKKVDLFLTHNERDCYLWGHWGRSCDRWRTCLDLTVPLSLRIEPEDKLTWPILCGSSYNHRANGLTGLIGCAGLGQPLWHHDRSTGYEERNREMPHLVGTQIEKEIPHSSWVDWLRGIAGTYIAVHPMPAAAAGRDQIAFAALGIPCVGNIELDAQRDLFPELCVTDLWDPRPIRELVQQLLVNQGFYRKCRDLAMERVGRYGLDGAAVQAANIKRMLRWE